MSKVMTDVTVSEFSSSTLYSGLPMSTNMYQVMTQNREQVAKRSKKLAQQSGGHDQFLTGILVSFNLTLSLKAWVEAERYTFLNFVSSQSTMHRIMKMPIDDMCNEYVNDISKQNLKNLIELYKVDPSKENRLKVLYNMPSGLTLTARMTTNYRCLKNIYHQRKDHALPEWRQFCKELEELPKFKEWFVEED